MLLEPAGWKFWRNSIMLSMTRDAHRSHPRRKSSAEVFKLVSAHEGTKCDPFCVLSSNSNKYWHFSKHIKVLFTFLYVLFAITSVSFRFVMSWRGVVVRSPSKKKKTSAVVFPSPFRHSDDLRKCYFLFLCGIRVIISCRAEYANSEARNIIRFAFYFPFRRGRGCEITSA